MLEKQDEIGIAATMNNDYVNLNSIFKIDSQHFGVVLSFVGK